MEREELIKNLNKIGAEILALDKLKPSAISYLVEDCFCKSYAIAILRIILALGIDPCTSDKANIYYFDIKRRNGFYKLKNSHIIGVGYWKYDKMPEWGTESIIEYEGSFFELRDYWEDTYAGEGWINTNQIYCFRNLEYLEELYNCLRRELYAKKLSKKNANKIKTDEK